MSSVTIERRAHVIVLGNEKGGSGKSTAAMHLIVGLLRDGYRVGALDLDARQATLSQYLAARQAFASPTAPTAGATVRRGGTQQLEAVSPPRPKKPAGSPSRWRHGDCDVIVIDCPGADTFLSRLGHARADTLVTPINDSYVDFAMLAKVDPDNHEVVRPTSTAKWSGRPATPLRPRSRADRLDRDAQPAGATEARNKRDVGATLEAFARRIGFRMVKGFGERVIFRELYLQGLTLMDVREAGTGHPSVDEPRRRTGRGARTDRGDPAPAM